MTTSGLRGATAGVPVEDPVWGIVGEFHRFLDEPGTRPRPDLPAAERRRVLDRLLSLALSVETDGTTKAVLLGSLFGMLRLYHLSPHLADPA